MGSAASAFEGDQEDWEPTVEQVKKAIREKVLESPQERPESTAQASRSGCSSAALSADRAGTLSPALFCVRLESVFLGTVPSV